jgi:hypothetical protein
MHLRFVESESTFDYFLAARSYLQRCGKPVAFYLAQACDVPGTRRERSAWWPREWYNGAQRLRRSSMVPQLRREVFRLSERFGCGVLGQHRSP